MLWDGLYFFSLTVRSRSALSAEILFLRKQLGFYEERQVPPRRLSDAARFSLVLWSRLFNWKDALLIVKPETLIGWHRKGFKLLWRWKSQAGRPRQPEKIRQLIPDGAGESRLLASRTGATDGSNSLRFPCITTARLRRAWRTIVFSLFYSFKFNWLNENRVSGRDRQGMDASLMLVKHLYNT